MSAPLQISLKEIETVTDNFGDGNFIGEGFLGKIYKGQLSVSGELIDVAVRRLDHSFWLQDMAFEKEISILTSLKHENMVSIVGFCYENNEMLIINKRVARGSLRRHLSDPRLTWMRRLQISIGAVSALSYLHDDVGKKYSIIHHNINSNTILLDENWEAKISGFEYSMSIPSGDLVLAYGKHGIGTLNSDVFSIGIVLFELLCGREAFVSKDDNSFQPSLATFHYVNGTLHKFVHPDLFSQMDLSSFNIFSETAYYCMIDQRAAPTMNQVLKRLEKALAVQQMHENNEHSTDSVERSLPDHLKLRLKSLKHMRIPLADILQATDNFSKGCIVSLGGYGSVHKAELDHVDRESCHAMEAENEHELPKKRSIVAIKRVINKNDEMAEPGFYAEIEMLTSCKHSNIITLLGFCEEGGEMILIYEYASNGSLSEYIWKKSEIHNDTWAQRVKICLDVARGLSCLHAPKGDRQEIVHRDIKSANILLDEYFEAKIGDFGLSVFLSDNKDHSTLYSRKTAGTRMYKDPQYTRDAKLRKELDVYSFGVVLVEILCGVLAYDPRYTEKNGLALVAREHFENGTTKEMVDPKIKEEITENLFNSVIGPNQESLDTFTNIAYKCLAEAQGDRPTMEIVIKELVKALSFQENRKEVLQIPLKDIQLATDNFSKEKFIFEDGFWEAYKGEVSRANGNTTSINVKRIYSDFHHFFDTELKVLMEYKHENVISLLGYCKEGGERIIVFEDVISRRLCDHLDDVSLKWEKRLKICIDIATGLDFLQGGSLTGEVVIHRNITSKNILLDVDMNAKISDFTLSVIPPVNQEKVNHSLKYRAGTISYVDPEYWRKGLLSKECDIYSFGIVLFNILLQRVTFGSQKKGHHLGPLIKDLYKKGKLGAMMFKGKNEQIEPQSLTIFRRLAIQCLHENRKERPTSRELIIQLKEALEIQEKGMNVVRISLEDIKYATDNFSPEKMIGKGAKGTVFKGELSHANGQKSIAVKQMHRSRMKLHGDPEFYQELEILFKFKHKNVIGLEAYCDEIMDEKIIVYEYASNGSLDKWLNQVDLTWMKRLKICIDVASGLNFLHGDVFRRESVIHRDVKSANILLSWDWQAKITHFGLSLTSSNNKEIDYVIEENPVGTAGYVDPAYLKTSSISKAADIYSFGVVLFEILCGRLAHWDNQEFLGPLAKNYHEQNKLDELVFEGIKEQIVPQSLSTFANIAYDCLHDDRQKRPTASELVARLNEALEFQVDCEIWESKLPKDYKEIIQQSRNPKIYNNKKKKDIYEMLCEGILIQKGKVLFSLDGNNQRNEMISATLFTYKNKSSLQWRRYRKSRFKRVSLIMDISNLMIQAHIKAQFLTPSVIYGVYLVFQFVEPNKISSEPPKYVNLKYKIKNETLHAYFATWRKDNWMMIELYRFLNDKEDGDFEILLESFSRYYCGSGAIYVEGIEFRAIDNLTNEELKDVKQITKSSSNIGEMKPFPADNYELVRFGPTDKPKKYYRQNDVNGKKCLLVSAKDVVRDYSMKDFNLIFSEESRFSKVVEVSSQQVFRINCRIGSRRLSSDTEYSCYLIFKLSKKCRGLHCPVKVRVLLRQSNKETKALYFRSPNAWNIHDINQVPNQREDGWMEVNVWKFNSKNDLKNDRTYVNLKLISYEGTMSGLIVCGLEFRPY